MSLGRNDLLVRWTMNLIGKAFDRVWFNPTPVVRCPEYSLEYVEGGDVSCREARTNNGRESMQKFTYYILQNLRHDHKKSGVVRRTNT